MQHEQMTAEYSLKGRVLKTNTGRMIKQPKDLGYNRTLQAFQRAKLKANLNMNQQAEDADQPFQAFASVF